MRRDVFEKIGDGPVPLTPVSLVLASLVYLKFCDFFDQQLIHEARPKGPSVVCKQGRPQTSTVTVGKYAENRDAIPNTLQQAACIAAIDGS